MRGRDHHASIACAILLQVACTRSEPAPTVGPPRPAGELTIMFSAVPDDRVVVHPDGSFDLVWPERMSRRACGGPCPRTVTHYVVNGDKIFEGSRELFARAADGTVDVMGMARVTIDEDGALVDGGRRYALDANGRYPHVHDQPDITVIGATTPALRRRAALVVMFVGVATMSAVIDLASH